MRRFLYLSPYFPPLSRVGALRPLKFARHLPTHGWAPVVLCDLWPAAQVDLDLLTAIPDSTIVVRRWSRRAGPAWRQLKHAPPAERDHGRVRSPPPAASSWPRRLIPKWLNNPELVPLGEHGPRMRRNLVVARETLAQHPCEAIVVNADPYSGCLVGAQLSKETGLPLLLDLRDPWALCELRRPRRPLPIRQLIDTLERRAVTQAGAVILNTETTKQDYQRHYRGLPADHFHCIRNNFDADLISGGRHPGFDRFSLLFLGNFGRFINAEILLKTLAELRRRGVPSQELQLVVTGKFPAESWRMAQGMGVQDMVRLHAHVPYRQIRSVMQSADALVLLIQPNGRQRFAAKFFDYLSSDRPIVAVSDNTELSQVLAQTQAGTSVRHGDVTGLADAIHDLWKQGRAPVRPRLADTLSSEAASATLAGILDRLTAK
ncbi:MAG: glycosyltransferase [Myxococcales bacterium]|nr:glycosyltransferase [Myxococcales bacterium]